MESTTKRARRSCNLGSDDYWGFVDQNIDSIEEDLGVNDYQQTKTSVWSSAPSVNDNHLYKVNDSYIWDSDEEDDNDKVLIESRKPWDAQAVREGVRPELVYPGRKWDDDDGFGAFFPHVKSAEFCLRATSQVDYWSSFVLARRFTSPVKFDPRQPQSSSDRIAVYLAVETVIRLVRSSNVDKLWAMAHDMEEYIRQALWPRSMLADAERIDKGLPSDVVALAKVIPRAYTPGFNNDAFWGRAVYIALRFPPALHPFKTPIVRDMIARLRACSEEDEDMWTVVGSEESTIINLAATWAGYHIARHLIARNAYHLGSDDIRVSYRDLDDMVRVVARKQPQIQTLFAATVQPTAPRGLEAEFAQRVSLLRWDTYAGSCHVVSLSQPGALPPPLRKPSIILKEMQVEQPLSDDCPWNATKPFTTLYDTPHGAQHSGKGTVRLSVSLTRVIKEVNERLASFLNSHSVQVVGRNDQCPATFADPRGLLEQVETVQHQCKNLDTDMASVQHCVDEIKARVLSSQAENKRDLESIITVFEARILDKIQDKLSLKRQFDEIREQVVSSRTESKQDMEKILAASEERVLDKVGSMIQGSIAHMKQERAKRDEMMIRAISSLFGCLEARITATTRTFNTNGNGAVDNEINYTAFRPQATDSEKPFQTWGAMLQRSQPVQTNQWVGPMQVPRVNAENVDFNGNAFAFHWPMAPTLSASNSMFAPAEHVSRPSTSNSMFAPMEQITRPSTSNSMFAPTEHISRPSTSNSMFAPTNHIDKPARRPASMDASGHVDRRPRLNPDRANNGGRKSDGA